MNRLAIFDCDGTLVDGQASHHRALKDCFAGAGFDAPSLAAARRLIGLGLVETMAVLLPEQEASLHHRLASDYKRAFKGLRDDGLVNEPLFDGIIDLIQELERDDWLLGVATGKSDRGLRLCLDHHGIAHRFVTLQTADRHPSKPHPSMVDQAIAEAGAAPETTAMIGDTSYDIAMARAAGVTAIGVAWGYHDPRELVDAGAHAIAETPAEILHHLRSIA